MREELFGLPIALASHQDLANNARLPHLEVCCIASRNLLKGQKQAGLWAGTPSELMPQSGSAGLQIDFQSAARRPGLTCPPSLLSTSEACAARLLGTGWVQNSSSQWMCRLDMCPMISCCFMLLFGVVIKSAEASVGHPGAALPGGSFEGCQQHVWQRQEVQKYRPKAD